MKNLYEKLCILVHVFIYPSIYLYLFYLSITMFLSASVYSYICFPSEHLQMQITTTVKYFHIICNFLFGVYPLPLSLVHSPVLSFLSSFFFTFFLFGRPKIIKIPSRLFPCSLQKRHHSSYQLFPYNANSVRTTVVYSEGAWM